VRIETDTIDKVNSNTENGPALRVIKLGRR